MLGAITGDTIGSVYEFNNTKEYNFTCFTSESGYTDDSVMTMAVAFWLLKDKECSYQSLEDSRSYSDIIVHVPWEDMGADSIAGYSSLMIYGNSMIGTVNLLISQRLGAIHTEALETDPPCEPAQ